MTRLVEPRPNTMRRDPGPTNKTFFGFVEMPQRGTAPVIEPDQVLFSGRPGHAERDMIIEFGDAVRISLTGWHQDTVALNERQALVLRDALNRRLPE